MAEWKGPWKCEKCGFIRPGRTVELVGTDCGRMPPCNGTLKPYDRRRAAPEVVDRYREVLIVCPYCGKEARTAIDTARLLSSAPEAGDRYREAIHFLRCLVARPDQINIAAARNWLERNKEESGE